MTDYVQVFVLWILMLRLHFLIQIGNVLIREWTYNKYSTFGFLNSVQLKTFIEYPIYVSTMLGNTILKEALSCIERKRIYFSETPI